MSERELSWFECFADLKCRGKGDPDLIIGDGANGLSAGVSALFCPSAQQRFP